MQVTAIVYQSRVGINTFNPCMLSIHTILITTIVLRSVSYLVYLVEHSSSNEYSAVQYVTLYTYDTDSYSRYILVSYTDVYEDIDMIL
jgi:hypothetical protein